MRFFSRITNKKGKLNKNIPKSTRPQLQGIKSSPSMTVVKTKDSKMSIAPETNIAQSLNRPRSQESLQKLDEIRNITFDPQFKMALASYDRQMNMLKKVMSGLVTSSTVNGMMLYGAPGSGKSYSMLTALDEMKRRGVKLEYHVIKGKITPLQLYEFVKSHPNKWDINIFDDCDSIFFDTEAMNLVKAMSDTYDERIVSYRSRAASAPSFIYRGKLICITNQNLNGNEHFIALRDRMSLFTLNLSFKEKFAKSIDVTISNPKYLHDPKYKEAADYVISFMNNHMYAFNTPDYSLRTVIRLIGMYELVGKDDFEMFVKGMKEFNWGKAPSKYKTT